MLLICKCVQYKSSVLCHSEEFSILMNYFLEVFIIFSLTIFQENYVLHSIPKYSFNHLSMFEVFLIALLLSLLDWCVVWLLYRIGTFSVFYVPSGMKTYWKLVINTKYLFLKYMSLSLFKLLYVFLPEIFLGGQGRAFLDHHISISMEIQRKYSKVWTKLVLHTWS